MPKNENVWHRRLIRRYGHRALFLWLFAVIYLSMSVTLMLMPPMKVIDLFHTYPPEWARSTIWAVGAIIAIATARGWERKYQWIGFWALCFAPAQRLMSYAFAVGINAYYWSPLAWARLSTMFIYVLWLLVIWLFSTVKDEIDLDQLASKILVPQGPVVP